jgi:hypothetical protein
VVEKETLPPVDGSVPVPNTVVPSRNSTEPFGDPLPEGLTVAVNVTFSP